MALRSMGKLAAEPNSGRGAPVPALLDVARGLAMVVVLYGHALEVFFLDLPDAAVAEAAFVQYKVLAAFAMPLFFLISGAGAARLPERGWRSALRTSLYLVILAYLVHGLGLLVMTAETASGHGQAAGELAVYALESTLKAREFSTLVVWFLVSLAIVRLLAFALFAYLPRRLALAMLGAAAVASLLTPVLPQAFMLKTWAPGIVFFGVGLALSGALKRLDWWPALLLAPVMAALALSNRGCAFDLLESCPHPALMGDTAVWLHIGQIGFPPLFFLTGLLGCAVAMAFARALLLPALAPLRIARLLGRIGTRSLDLLVINGFVLVFLQPRIGRFTPAEPELWVYPLLLVAVVGMHQLALRLLARPLAALNRLALLIAGRLMAALFRERDGAGSSRDAVVKPS